MTALASAPWRWRTLLADSLSLVGIAWSVPLAVLLVGTPIALAITFALWLGDLLSRAF